MRKFSGCFPITKKEKFSDIIYKYAIRSPEIAVAALPGQFVQIRTSDDYFPLWPRPFSIFDVDTAKGQIEIIFKVFGCGTSQLADFSEGDKVHLLGPLGNGFPPLQGDNEIIMAAGGVGMPPLYFLTTQSIRSGFSAERITFISGARKKSEHLGGVELSTLGVDLRVCTDDGTLGEKGTVVDLLEKVLIEKDAGAVYACGPNPMLEKIDAISVKENIPCMLSLEALMPCGLGICSGCAIRTIPSQDRGPTDDYKDYHLKRVCVEGPVFRSGEVIWG